MFEHFQKPRYDTFQAAGRQECPTAPLRYSTDVKVWLGWAFVFLAIFFVSLGTPKKP